MGGRGGNSGIVVGNGVSYASADHTLTNEQPLKSKWILGTNTGNIVRAVTDEKGNITLSNMPAEEYEVWSKKKTFATTTIKHGITDMSEDDRYIGSQSVGINWDAVKTVSGKTYEHKEFIKSKGFSWNKENKRWERNN